MKARSLKIPRARMIQGDRQFPLEDVRLEMSFTGEGQMSVYASSQTRARLLGLTPGEGELQVVFPWKGREVTIEGVEVFDIDLLPTGITAIQWTGFISSFPEE
jgi:hypothetical protein